MTDAVMLMANKRSSRKLGRGTSMTKTTETAADGTIQSKFAFFKNDAGLVASAIRCPSGPLAGRACGIRRRGFLLRRRRAFQELPGRPQRCDTGFGPRAD